MKTKIGIPALVIRHRENDSLGMDEINGRFETLCLCVAPGTCCSQRCIHCELKDTAGHLLAAFGRLHQHLEHFPEERFLRAMNNCWSVFFGQPSESQ